MGRKSSLPLSKTPKVLSKCCSLLQRKASHTDKQSLTPSRQWRLWKQLTERGWGAVKIVRWTTKVLSAWKGKSQEHSCSLIFSSRIWFEGKAGVKRPDFFQLARLLCVHTGIFTFVQLAFSRMNRLSLVIYTVLSVLAKIWFGRWCEYLWQLEVPELTAYALFAVGNSCLFTWQKPKPVLNGKTVSILVFPLL